MKSAEEIMEILEAYDLTGSLRDAAELAGCSHHTVASLVAARERGELTPGGAERRDMLVDPYREKLEEWVDRSRGKVRADVAHEKLIPLGYTGSERTHPAGCRRGQDGLLGWAPAGAQALGGRAGDVVSVRLW